MLAPSGVYVLTVVAGVLARDWVLARWAAKQAVMSRAGEIWDLP